MVTNEAYTDIVKQHFNYLIHSYGFAECSLEEHSRVLVVGYCKGERLVKVEYSHINETIEVAIYNHISVVPPGSYDWRYSVSLAHLMKRDLPQFDYERDYKSLMPSNLPLVEAVQRVAVLFERHAVNIISDQEWVSWGELTGYSNMSHLNYRDLTPLIAFCCRWWCFAEPCGRLHQHLQPELSPHPPHT